jgi:hypothetical protein
MENLRELRVFSFLIPQMSLLRGNALKDLCALPPCLIGGCPSAPSFTVLLIVQSTLRLWGEIYPENIVFSI